MPETTTKGLFSILRSDPHQHEAKAALKQLRKDIDEFHRVRLLNEMALRGTDRTCRYKPVEMRQRLEAFRDPRMERRFQEEAVDLLRTIYRRDPTPEEIHAGIPSEDGLGGAPPLLGIAAVVAGSAWGLHSVTKYLSEREVLARGGVESGGPLRLLGRSALVLGVVAGSGYAAWRGYRWIRGWLEEREDAKLLVEGTTEEDAEELEEQLEEVEEQLEEVEERAEEITEAELLEEEAEEEEEGE